MTYVVVEGCGQWAMQYLEALTEVAGSGEAGVFFTFDSTFGLENERLPVSLFKSYLEATLRNVERIEKAGFACIDVKDTLYAVRGRSADNPNRQILPRRVDYVFVVTPDRTHCDVAEKWLGRARRIFVEKPFDLSERRIEAFIDQAAGSCTEVYALDHYFVRANHAAVDGGYYLAHLFGDGPAEITGFEFRMTEPCSDLAAVRERALSLQEGMVFDMGSHAIPILLPFLAPETLRLLEASAGVSERLADLFFKGGDSFAAAVVEGTPPAGSGLLGTVRGTLAVGKDVGLRPEKWLKMQGLAGGICFDLANYTLDRLNPKGEVEESAGFLGERWARFLVREFLAGRVPRAVSLFRPSGAQVVIRFLETWKRACRNSAGLLARYQAGTPTAQLVGDTRFKTMQGVQHVR